MAQEGSDLQPHAEQLLETLNDDKLKEKLSDYNLPKKGEHNYRLSEIHRTEGHVQKNFARSGKF